MNDTFMTGFASEANDVLAAILDQSVESIKLLNLDGEFEYINPTGLRAMEIESAESLLGKSWISYWPKEREARARQAVDRAKRGQQDRFEGFRATMEGRGRWWDVNVSPITNSLGQVTHILVNSRDITHGMQLRLDDRMRREEAEGAAQLADSVAREMRHRLKNQLAVVGSVTKLIARHAKTPEDVIDRLENKLQALARAQDMLTLVRDGPITADVAIAQVLQASGAGDKVEVGTIPQVGLGDDAIQQLALVMGELQTNSLKYGALSHADGNILLTAAMQGGALAFHWHEEVGEEIEPPSTTGSGFTLLQRLGSTAGKVAGVQWHKTGLTYDFYVRPTI